jgi:hypothetical protein
MPWTLVQHSAFGYMKKPGFEHAVEERIIETKREIALVKKEGGVIIDGYVEASELAYALNYPSDAELGLYPGFRGTFSEKEVDGLRIAVPVRKVVA